FLDYFCFFICKNSRKCSPLNFCKICIKALYMIICCTKAYAIVFNSFFLTCSCKVFHMMELIIDKKNTLRMEGMFSQKSKEHLRFFLMRRSKQDPSIVECIVG